MKTNQKLAVTFSLGNLVVGHKDLMLELEGFVNLLNKYRIEEDLKTIPQNTLLQRTTIKEFISSIGSDSVQIGKGRAKSFIHLKVAIRLAIDLSPSFASEVIDIFIDKKLAHLRDFGGDNFIEMNDALTLYAEGILGKEAHKGHFITIAKLLKERLKVDSWNKATPFQLSERARIEQILTSMLRTGVVRDWEHLKELCEIV